MASRFVVVVAALACVTVASAYPRAHAPVAYAKAPACAAPLPALPPPTVVQSVVPGPVNVGPQPAGVIEHASAPYEINYFGKPWVLKHLQSAALNVFGQTPVVVDEYAPPAFSEALAPPAVIVEAVQGAPVNIAPPAAAYAPAYAPAYGHYGHPAPLALGAFGCH